MNLNKKHRLFIYSLSLFSSLTFALDAAYSADTTLNQSIQGQTKTDAPPTTEKTWWNEWEGFVKMMDQSTQPAPDFIPYDRIKFSIYQQAIVPTQKTYDKLTGNEQAPNPTGLQNYQPKSPQDQAAGREQTTARLKNQSQANPRNAVATDDLANLPNDRVPRTPGNIAPQGDWQKIPGKQTGPSFYERNLPKVKKMLADDPKNHTGSLKMLDTLRTMQMLIECKEQGFTAKQCASLYIQNFATGKAVSELLNLLGASTVGVYGSLVYADYIAIQNIKKMIEIHQAMQEDAERNRKQALENDMVDYAHWNGELDSLQKILEIFLQQYTSRQNPLNADLLDAWARSDKLIEQVKEKRSELANALSSYRESNELEQQLQKSCPERGKPVKAHNIQSECREIINNALNESGHPLEEFYNSSDFIRQYQENCEKKADSEIKICTNSREKILQKANDASMLQKPALKFKLAYENCVTAVLVARDILEQYKTNQTIFEGRKTRLVQFLKPQAHEMLRMREKELSQALRMIEDMERSLAEYKPKPSYFDSIEGYQQSIDGMISDLKFMRDIPEKLVTTIKDKTARLEKSVPPPEKKDECRQVARLEACLNKCDTMEAMFRSELQREEYRAAQGTLKTLRKKGCPYTEELKVMVPVPDISGLTYQEALPKVQKSGIRFIIAYSGQTPDAEESQHIYGQSPAAGAKIEMDSNITAHFKRYDPDAAPTDCMTFKEIYQKAMVRKDPQFKLAEDIMKRAEKQDCYWLDKARVHLAETRTQYEKFKTEKDSRCADLKVRYQRAMTGQQPALEAGKNLLVQAEACDWAERAQKHYDQVARSWEETRQEKFCSELKKSYQEAMVSSSPDFQQGSNILSQADRCEWQNKARDHYAQTKSAYDQNQQKLQEEARKCSDLRVRYLRAMSGDQPSFTAGANLLDQAEDCDWAPGEKYRYDKKIAQQKELDLRCEDLRQNYLQATRRADKTMDSTEIKSVLAQSKSCGWHQQAADLLPCMEGDFNGIKAYNSGNLQLASDWAAWGRKNNCYYVEHLTGLVNNAYQRQQQQNRPVRTQQPRQKTPAEECAEMNAQLLAGCQSGNHSVSGYFENRWNALGCKLSPAVESCIEAWIDRKLDGMFDPMVRGMP